MNNKLNSFLERAKKIPELGFVEAINVDRFFKDNNTSEFGTFSVNGFSPNLTISNIPISKKLNKNKNTLKKIEELKLNSKEAYIQAFQELEGIEIETLNLLYANYLAEQHDYIAWKYFFNKYLISRKGFKINLRSFVFDNIFEVIESEKPVIKQESELVSVIMPSYNSEKTISYAIESILNQTHQNIELIIVDDCSTDNTEKICKEFISKDSRIKFIRNNQNSGAYISRNNGLKIANGDYITILDADDFSFAERITYQLERIKETKAKAHLGYYLRINEKGKFVSFRITGKFSYDGALHKCLASMMIEKKFFDEVLGYWDSVRFGADSELYYRILAIDEKLIVEDIVPLYLALDRENSLTNSEETKIGGELRSQYAKAFLDFHKNSTVEQLYYTFPQTKRPFVVPKEMELNSTIQIDIAQLSVEPITDLQQLKKIKSNISRFDFLTEEFKYQCLWQLNKKSKYLFVLFHGANDRSKKQPPYFERWSWQNDFNGSILNISDSTLALDDKLRLAWYIGNKNEYPVKTIVSVVKEFANIHGIENSNIIFYGSSGTGYTSLACSRYIPNSNAVAINAQTNVLNYHQGHVTDMLKACFDSIDQNEIWQKYKERLDMVDYYSNNKYSNNIFLVQNEKDEFHYKNHFLPFIEKTNLSKEKILLYSNESGHGPEPRNMVKEILKKAGIGNNFLWLSMGENCLTDNILQRFNKKSFSTPYSSNRTNIDYILTCEKDRYKTLLLKENLVYDTLFDKKVVRSKFIQKCDDIYDKYHMKGFEFTHHDVIESQKDRESYDRRSKRLLDGREKENFVFLYFHRYNPKSNIELLRKKLNDLISFYKGNQNSVFIIFFYQQLIKDTSKRRIKIKKINDNFFEYVYHTQFNWAGNNPEIFWGLNDNDLISEMIKDVEQKISNIENKTEITINKNFNINNKKIFLLGTCRLHRLFIKNTKGQIIDNTDQRLTIEYPKIGFFHTLPEILQIIKWVKRDVNIPSNLAKYIFRKENPSTTPQNEFDESLEKAIKENQLIESPKMDLKEIDYFIFEICSLKAYFDTESKLYFHANPNFAGNIAYNQIPKEGIYSKNALNIPSVENQFQSTDLMEKHFSELFEILEPNKTIIFGHLLDPNSPNQTRKEVNDMLKTMSDKFKFKYVDTSLFVQKFGFNMPNEGGVDIHHLSNDGEIEFGKYVQKIILEEEIVI